MTREEAIKEIQDASDYEVRHGDIKHHYEDIMRRVEAFEKAVNALQKYKEWIPVSERLPKDSQFVLMTIRRMGEHYNREPFISVGYISWNQTAWWCAHDGDCKSHDVIVDAWMPLPEPYKAESEG